MPTTTAPAGPRPCPEVQALGFTLIGDKGVKMLHNNTVTRGQAAGECSAVGATLFSVKNAAEEQLARDLSMVLFYVGTENGATYVNAMLFFCPRKTP